MNRVLIAAVGNVLRGDDGFGAAVIEAFQRDGLVVDGIRIADVGIGGIALIHELLDGFDALIAVDCVDRGGAPGTLYVLDVRVPTMESIPEAEHVALTADLHEIGLDRVLLVARAAGALPRRVWLVGCQPAQTEEFSMELSGPVRAAVPAAVDAIRGLIRSLSEDIRAAEAHDAGA
jgi:hydrogenase maturation protease